MLKSALDEKQCEVKSTPTHTPVMLKEVTEHLNLKVNDCVVDFTVGLGGHSLPAIESIKENGHFIGIDRDQGALDLAEEKIKDISNHYDLIQDDFRNIDSILNNLGVNQVDAMLLDLGVSSLQLDDPERGFSFIQDGPLDMRMDRNGYISAFDLVNSLSEKELSSIIRNFGEERWHRRIAHFLVEQRALKPIASTKDLSDIVMRSIPARFKRQRIHPATRTFQAIRIAVNRELESLEVALDKCINYLKVGGRICVIAFHSLEDRIVKQKFRHLAKFGEVELLTKKPLQSSEEEIQRNPRSRSARLRVAEKI